MKQIRTERLSDEYSQAAALLEYRRKNFAVKVRRDHDRLWHPNGITLSVTTNGYQWSAISLLPEEIDRVIAALKAAQCSQKARAAK
jgi:hypothetical protein